MGDGLAAYLKKLRAEKKYTLKEAGDRTNIAEAYLWQLENGKREVPRPETLRKLAEGYGMPLENLLKYAGYLEQPTDPKKEAEAETKVLFRDYEKLSEEKKKMFQMFLRSLQSQK